MIDYDDDDARRYDDDGDEFVTDYGDICPRCFEFWKDCDCEDDYREDRDNPETSPWNDDD